MHEVTFTPEELAAAKEQLDSQKAAEQLKQDVLSMPEKPEPEEVMARPLKASDIFPMTIILSKIGLNEFAKCLNGDSVAKLSSLLQEDGNGLDNGAAAVVGVSVVLEIANVIFSHLDRCEADINKFIASIYGLKHEEVGELDPAVYLEMIVNIAEDEKFVDFIKVATKLFNKVK